MTDTAKYWELLSEVVDPEFPISVVDMGLIRKIDWSSADALLITMTYTSVGCACMQWIEADIKNALEREPEVGFVQIETVWDPPWTVECLTQRGKEIFAEWGLAVS